MKSLITVAIAVGIAVAGVIAYRPEARKAVVEYLFGGGEISAQDRESAQAKMRKIFTSAQNSFIHRMRHDRRMASSIDELGDGFRSNGALIYYDIWLARYGRPSGEKCRDEDLEFERKALASPYRYAVLPVNGLFGDKDRFATCIIAIPSEKGGTPALVMLAGPVENDPGDFRRDWKIHEVKDMEKISFIRQRLVAHGCFDKQFNEMIGIN